MAVLSSRSGFEHLSLRIHFWAALMRGDTRCPLSQKSSEQEGHAAGKLLAHLPPKQPEDMCWVWRCRRCLPTLGAAAAIQRLMRHAYSLSGVRKRLEVVCCC